MDMCEATGRIKIAKTPAGEAPLEIRRAWIALILPCYPFLRKLSAQGALSGTPQKSRLGVCVPQEAALVVLDRQEPDAARWWRAQGFPRPGECFVFGENEIEIVSGVSLAEMDPWSLEAEMSADPEFLRR